MLCLQGVKPNYFPMPALAVQRILFQAARTPSHPARAAASAAQIGVVGAEPITNTETNEKKRISVNE
jgi:hypothetical protein